jgi:hypothetical protein
MNVLRIRLDAKPAPDRAAAWALFDATGACVKMGRDRKAGWPGADRLEVVLAAIQARIASVMLPPMPASRVAGAATFALEDQLAGPNTAHHVAVSAQGRDGRVRVAVVARSLVAEIVDDYPDVTRIVAECDLCPPATDWKWCAREPDAPGFIRRPDGSALPVEAPSPEGTLPPELAMALAQARRGAALRARARGSALSGRGAARWRAKRESIRRRRALAMGGGLLRHLPRPSTFCRPPQRPVTRRPAETRPLCAGAPAGRRRACAARDRELR